MATLSVRDRASDMKSSDSSHSTDYAIEGVQDTGAVQMGEYIIGDMSIDASALTDRTLNSPEYDDEVHSISVTPKMLQDSLSLEFPIKPVLLMSGGLPNSGKSQAIKQLLKLLQSSREFVKEGFTHYDVMSVGQRSGGSCVLDDSRFCHIFSFLAGLKTNFHDNYQHIDGFVEDSKTPPPSIDSEESLKTHRLNLAHYWGRLQKQRSIIADLLHSKSLKKGPALVKIWDVAFDSFSLQFLRCFSGHFYNSYMWLFTDVERDQRNLHLPPSKDETQLMARRSRIQYLLNPCRISSKLKCERENVCTVFAKHTGVLDESLKDRIIALQREYKAAGPQLGCSKLIREKAIPISFDGVSSQRVLIEQLQKAVPKASQMIPLSHLFLRGSLELQSSVFMRREELKRKARLCGIDDDESFDEFCKSFTSFGSIIDASLVSTSDIIIVKPDEFLTTLDQAFNFERIKDYQVAHGGILTTDIALSLLGKEYQLFLKVLEAVGLATSVAGGQCQPPQDTSQCYYMPSLRQHGEEKYYKADEVQMITSLRYPSITMEVALTNQLLQVIPDSQLVLTGKKNVTIIKCHDEKQLEIIYHGEVVEFIVTPSDSGDIIMEVVRVCKGLALRLEERYGEPKFHFAVLCKEDNAELIGFNYNRKRHILPVDDIDCESCTSANKSKLKLWSSIINEVKIDEHFKLNGSLTSEDVMRLSTEISTYKQEYIEAFMDELVHGRPSVLPDDKSKWWCVIMEVVARWIMEPHKESTKKKMAVILIRLHERYKKESFSSGRKVRFKKLARELDLQTLTIVQKTNISKERH